MNRRAVFLDRDGVLVRAFDRGGGAIHGPLTLEEFEILPGVAAPVTRLRAAGFLAVMVTNQPGISRGVLSRENLNEMHRRLAGAGVTLDYIGVCPHSDADACACRKPKPGLLLDCARDTGVALEQSWMIGDTWRDAAAAAAAGVRFLLVDAPYNHELQACTRVRSLTSAADIILENASWPAGQVWQGT